jgi:glycosyltransferase involved in cell wall biosynthesis
LKITVLCNDLSGQAAGRAFALAKALEHKYIVEVVGPLFGNGVWFPVRAEFDYKTVKGLNNPFFGITIQKLLGKISGDIIYAVKPHMSSFGIALTAKMLHEVPVILDIDDWELGFAKNFGYFGMLKMLPKELIRPGGYPYTYIFENLYKKADALTFSSKFLQHKYGGVGTIIPHGRDTDFLDPKKYESQKMKFKYGFRGKQVVLFLGSPGPGKGVQDLAHAIDQISNPNIKLVIAGDTRNNKFVKDIYVKYNHFVSLIGFLPFSQIPELLAMADLVVLPQRRIPGTIGQVPAKVFDAMAMEKPIIATNVSDLPSILSGCGIIVEPQDINSLAIEIREILGDKEQALKLGRSARQKCEKYYSIRAMEKKLDRIIGNLSNN